MTRKYNLKPDAPDTRDRRYTAAPPVIVNALPPVRDLRAHCPAVYDQGQLGSCSANAIAGAMEFEQIRQLMPPFVPSRLFIYYNERALEGDVPDDAGAITLRDGLRAAFQEGAPPEAIWPYNEALFATLPPKPAYAAGILHKLTSYRRLAITSAAPDTLTAVQQLRACLAAGFPFIFGFMVFPSFESDGVAKTGIVPMPAVGETSLGGHAVMGVGYDDVNQRFLVRNSWGSGWGLAGYFTMPYAYLANPTLAFDFWTVRLVE